MKKTQSEVFVRNLLGCLLSQILCLTQSTDVGGIVDLPVREVTLSCVFEQEVRVLETCSRACDNLNKLAAQPCTFKGTDEVVSLAESVQHTGW